jgi:predicted CXXCH cytochrome family protein
MSNDHHPVPPVVAEIRKLSKPIPGRRELSWVLFLVFLGFCLLLPLGASLYSQDFSKTAESVPIVGSATKALAGAGLGVEHPEAKALAEGEPSTHPLVSSTNAREGELHRQAGPTFMAFDKVWNPGHSLSNAHRRYINDCKVCHVKPFVQVRDEDCQTCHKNAGAHVDANIAKVASLQGATCESCHREHNGEDGLAQQNKYYQQQNCASCHKDIKKSFAESKDGNASNFYSDHPNLRYLIANTPDAKHLQSVRISEAAPLIEKTGLKFPHDVHLKASGIRSPEGKVKLECASCHRETKDGIGFQPVTMERDCQSCHDLKFDPSVTNYEVPHGSVEAVLNSLRTFYSYTMNNAIPSNGKPLVPISSLVRPGVDENKSVVSFVHSAGDPRGKAVAAATNLFEKSACNLCHEVSRSSESGRSGTPSQDMPQWKIAPVTAEHAWMGKTAFVFSHEKHKGGECTECHAAEKSKKAEEVLMPTIKICRDCHAGSEPVANKIVSDCALCHGFHQHPAPSTKASKEHPEPEVIKTEHSLVHQHLSLAPAQ